MLFENKTRMRIARDRGKSSESTARDSEITRRAQAIGASKHLTARKFCDSERTAGTGHVSIYPHGHRMWAVIRILGGREDNSFYRRSESGVIAHGGKTLSLKETFFSAMQLFIQSPIRLIRSQRPVCRNS